MKKAFLCLLIVGIWLAPSDTHGQSTVEYQTGSAIEVQTGADVSADNIITNSNYSGGGTFNGGPLPVTMTAMSVQATKNTATITWRTESETENFGFEIERREMGQREMGQILTDTHRSESENDGVKSANSSPFTLYSSPWATIGFVPGSGTSSSPRDYSFVDKPGQPGRYAYRIKQIDHSGAFTHTASVEVEIGLAPREFTLSQNYPNPFNPTTTIEFTLPEDGQVILKVFDLAGKEVATLVNGELKTGVYHRVVFDASRLASGMYVSQLEARGKITARRMMLVK